MTRYLTRDRIAILAALAAPLAAAAILLPFRASWSNTNVALLLVVVVVGVAAIGNRVAGAPGGGVGGGLVRLLLHPAVLPVHDPQLRRCHDRGPAAGDRPGRVAAGGPRPAAEGHRDHRCGLPRADPRDRLAGPVGHGPRCRGRSRPGAAHRPAGPGRSPLRVRIPARPPAAPGAGRHRDRRVAPGGTSSSRACPRRRSSCAPSATASTTAGSCSRPSRAPGPRCRRGWSPSRWPIRPDARSAPARPRGACPDQPARRPKAAEVCLMPSRGG